MKVSIVVPTYKRGEMLYDTLCDLQKQKYPDFEIIVVDQTINYSDDLKKKFATLSDLVKFVIQEEPDVVKACNLGVRKANGDIIILVDDDVKISKTNFIQAHIDNYRNSEIGGVAGQILHQGQKKLRNLDPKYRPGYKKDKLPWMFLRLDTGQKYDIETGLACNLSFRKKIWEDLNGFDETFLGNAYRWESDFCFRLTKLGYRLVFEPKASLVHLYGQAGGGCENTSLFGTNKDVVPYLTLFFRNNLYFYLKLCPMKYFYLFYIRLYREHVLNRAYLKKSIMLVGYRHLAFAKGSVLGFFTWIKKRG